MPDRPATLTGKSTAIGFAVPDGSALVACASALMTSSRLPTVASPGTPPNPAIRLSRVVVSVLLARSASSRMAATVLALMVPDKPSARAPRVSDNTGDCTASARGSERSATVRPRARARSSTVTLTSAAQSGTKDGIERALIQARQSAADAERPDQRLFGGCGYFHATAVIAGE